MTEKKLANGWIRDTAQEDASVLKWYENPKKDIIASLVIGSFPNEGEWRISGKGFNSIESRGDKRIMERKSDTESIRIIESLIRREKAK